MKFKPPSKSLSFTDYVFIIIVAVAVWFVASSLLSFNYGLGGGGDFYMHLTASDVFIFDKVSPYGLEVPERAQLLAYGRAANAGEKPYILDTPFHLVLFYFPFALFSDPAFARAVYVLLLEAALIPLALLSLRLTDWQAPLLLSGFFITLCVVNVYAIEALYESGPALLLGLFYAGILLALRYDMDEVAGALIAISFYRWSAGAPFLFLIALRAYREKRSGVLYGFLMLTTIAFIVSIFVYANWIIPFLRAALNNLRVDFGYNLRAVLAEIFPAQGNIIAWVVMILLYIALTYEWSVARDADFRRFYWAACLSIAAAPLLGFRTEMSNLSVLVIPQALIFAVVHDRWRSIGNFLVPLLMFLVLLVPWALALFPFKFSREIIFLFLPTFTVIGLYWTRWWALRPPRIWSDLAPR